MAGSSVVLADRWPALGPSVEADGAPGRCRRTATTLPLLTASCHRHRHHHRHRRIVLFADAALAPIYIYVKN